jgi:hypothetical protein
MRSIAVTYPDFRLLPKGLKSMLLLSESLFFEEAKAVPVVHVTSPQSVRARVGVWAGVFSRHGLEAENRFWAN